jgi:hypothetical protein
MVVCGDGELYGTGVPEALVVITCTCDQSSVVEGQVRFVTRLLLDGFFDVRVIASREERQPAKIKKESNGCGFYSASSSSKFEALVTLSTPNTSRTFAEPGSIPEYE